MSDTTENRALGSRYELRERIGQGASGTVWRTWDRLDNRMVAAKILWPHFTHDEEVLTRFIRERTILTGLDHPNIVHVTDLVLDGDHLAIIMDLVEGPTLAHLLKQHGTIPPILAVQYAAVTLDALAYAHSHGVFHRDVKPDNILLPGADTRPEDLRLADFGIARLTRDGTPQGTETLGTPYYMAPELVAYGKFGPESDVYSTGILLYELLAGRTPYAGEGTDITVSLRHLQSAPPPLPVAASLWNVLDTMLAKDPAHRLNAADTARALRAIPPADLPDQPLPIQPVPDDWNPSPEVLPSKTIIENTFGYSASHQVETQTDVQDPSLTGIRAARPVKARPAPVTPEPTPVPAPGGMTQVKAITGHGLPTPPAPATPPTPGKKKALLISVGSAAAILIVVVTLWLVGIFQPGGPARPPVTTTASHLTGDTLPTGLRIDLDAAYDHDQDMTLLTITLATTPAGGLSGDILLDIPGLSGQCPDVTVQPPATIHDVKASTDGISAPCGHILTSIHIDAGQTIKETLTVDLDLFNGTDQTPTDYSRWLDTITRATIDDLQAITGTGFPLQRVTGLTIDVSPVTLTDVDGTPVPYKVYAKWQGDPQASPPTQILAQDTIDGMETTLLLNLTGDAGLDAIGIDTCGATSKMGIRILARQPTATCTLQIRIGAMTTPPASFAINMR